MPLFTQKHYEYLQRELSRMPLHPEVLERVVEYVCDAFERDNPNFKRETFTRNALRRST